MDAYLDIETTGFSCYYHKITVVGIAISHGRGDRLIQLVDQSLNPDTLLDSLRGVDRIFTYNGHRFDLPFIKSCLGVDLTRGFYHHDLMFDCWRCNLYGGLKAVERQLGIPRRLAEVNGYMAVLLWEQYQRYGDLQALRTLLEYNAEDVLNLKALRAALATFPPHTSPHSKP